MYIGLCASIPLVTKDTLNNSTRQERKVDYVDAGSYKLSCYTNTFAKLKCYTAVLSDPGLIEASMTSCLLRPKAYSQCGILPVRIHLQLEIVMLSLVSKSAAESFRCRSSWVIPCRYCLLMMISRTLLGYQGVALLSHQRPWNVRPRADLLVFVSTRELLLYLQSSTTMIATRPLAGMVRVRIHTWLLVLSWDVVLL